MKVAAAVLSWIGGILTIIIMWSSFGPLLGYELAFLAIPLVFTFITIAVLIYRQWATNHGSKVLAGVLTIIFCGLLGGIFTLCIPESDLGGYVYQPKKNSYLNPTSSSLPPRKEYSKPVRVGDRIQVINGFYISGSGKRVDSGTISTAKAIDNYQVTFIVTQQNGIVFTATTGMSNLRIIGRTTQIVESPKEEAKQIEKVAEEVKETPTEKLDKFEEIKKYKELLDLNIITQEEFDAKKKELDI